MGVFDQSARYAAQCDPEVVPARLLADSGKQLPFQEWYDTRGTPLPNGSDRTADSVAILDDPSSVDDLWLMVLEYQAQPDPDKFYVTLEEVAVLASRARYGDSRRRYKVIAGMVYLVGSDPVQVLDMRLPSGAGTLHAPLMWNVATDNAATTVEAVAAGGQSWGMLFWIPLMNGGNMESLVSRWREVVTEKVASKSMRGDLVVIAMNFAELAGCWYEWNRGLEDFEMEESRMTTMLAKKGSLTTQRQNINEILSDRFAGEVPEEVVQLINQQESMELLHDWFRAAYRADTFEAFMAVLRR